MKSKVTNSSTHLLVPVGTKTIFILCVLCMQFSNATPKITTITDVGRILDRSNIGSSSLNHYSLVRSSATKSLNLSDGEQIALEVTNQLLPPQDLSDQINSELRLIKLKYRVVSKINHQRKWVPGQLITTRITSEQIRQLNETQEEEGYGLKDITQIDLQPFYVVTILTFLKPYNPLALGEILKFKYGFSSSPNTVYMDGDADIFYSLGEKTYIFKKRMVRDDDDTMITHYWEFSTDGMNGGVKLVKEYEIDQDGNRRFDFKYNSVRSNK